MIVMFTEIGFLVNAAVINLLELIFNCRGFDVPELSPSQFLKIQFSLGIAVIVTVSPFSYSGLIGEISIEPDPGGVTTVETVNVSS
jgi:hypothetical protein